LPFIKVKRNQKLIPFYLKTQITIKGGKPTPLGVGWIA